MFFCLPCVRGGAAQRQRGCKPFLASCFLASGSLPECCRFLASKSDGKTATVSRRWTPTRAAALDPGSAATLRRPTQALGGLSKEGFKWRVRKVSVQQPYPGNGFKTIPCSPAPRPVNRPSLGGRISGSGAAAPAGGRRIGTAGPFRFLFGHEKEGLSGCQPSPPAASRLPSTLGAIQQRNRGVLSPTPQMCYNKSHPTNQPPVILTVPIQEEHP